MAGSQALAQSDGKVIRLSAVSLPPVVTPDHDGYLDNLIMELFSRVGMKVVFESLPIKRVLHSVNKGTIDGDAGRLREAGKGLPNVISLNEPLFFVEFGGFYIDPEISVTRLDDFKDHSVGFLQGWINAENLFGDGANVVRARTPDSLFGLLAEGRIDIAFMTYVPGMEI
ncbi:MAG: hypothetical protein KJN60_01940, partial [Boseongicola sp.]|nr:hypothetical protein [Boseongicola sp.]